MAPQPIVMQLFAFDPLGNEAQNVFFIHALGDRGGPSELQRARQSRKSCMQLRWISGSERTDVCGNSFEQTPSDKGGGRGCTPRSFVEANRLCLEAGARLCTSDELLNGPFSLPLTFNEQPDISSLPSNRKRGVLTKIISQPDRYRPGLRLRPGLREGVVLDSVPQWWLFFCHSGRRGRLPVGGAARVRGECRGQTLCQVLR